MPQVDPDRTVTTHTDRHRAAMERTAAHDLVAAILERIETRTAKARTLAATQPTPMRFLLVVRCDRDHAGKQLEVTLDAAADLRRYAAEKRIVGRHSQRGHSVPFAGYHLDYCRACGQLMPCSDLTDIAASYGIDVIDVLAEAYRAETT